jgi:hypothetical protein
VRTTASKDVRYGTCKSKRFVLVLSKAKPPLVLEPYWRGPFIGNCVPDTPSYNVNIEIHFVFTSMYCFYNNSKTANCPKCRISEYMSCFEKNKNVSLYILCIIGHKGFVQVSRCREALYDRMIEIEVR